MKTLLRSVVAIALLVGCAHAASAQTADDVVEKVLTALGGRAALGKLTSRTMVGTVTLSTPAGELSGPVEITTQAPNKSRTLIKLDLSSFGAGQMVFDQRFDGTVGYVLDSLQGNRDITGSQLDAMKINSFPNPLMNYKETGATVELGGKEKVGERDAYVLVFKPKGGPVVREFVDAESFIPLKQTVKLDIPPVGEIEQTTEFLDHRDVNGIQVPFKIRNSSSVQSSTVIITKVEHNVTIDPALFAKP